jgi:hypothetical protein
MIDAKNHRNAPPAPIGRLEELKELESYCLRLSTSSTVSKTFRIPEIVYFRCERLARQLDLSLGKLFTELFNELLPAIEKGEPVVGCGKIAGG